MTVYDLYQLIPNFEELCDIYYDKWEYFMDQILVPRMGFVKFGHYHPDLVKQTLYEDRLKGMRIRPDKIIIDDAHHDLSCQKMVQLFEDFFGVYVTRMFNFAPQWERVRNALLDHEVGENEIGDWTDDKTSDRDLKDRLELEAYERYLEGFPREAKNAHRDEFILVQQGDNITKCFDKTEFILMQGWCRKYRIEGSMAYKNGVWHLSEQDKHYRDLTDSDRPVDNLFAHFLDITRGIPTQPFFVGIIESMYRKRFGEVPETVRKLY
ncbi:hypothetical protein IJ380_01550 [Candidatus Saccharibacteria bacterium]|nr:hypothetical protein [Candidatus Saccharibacteria bacterium]